MLSAAIGVCLRPASQAVMGNMKEEIEKAPLPIIHHGVDLWTCTRSGRKFIHVHAFHVDSNFILRLALLAVSHEIVEYVPSLVDPCQLDKSCLLFTGGMAQPTCVNTNTLRFSCRLLVSVFFFQPFLFSVGSDIYILIADTIHVLSVISIFTFSYFRKHTQYRLSQLW